ncbi:hypothetical protein MKW98_017692, partial [Papaver atlanticum]
LLIQPIYQISRDALASSRAHNGFLKLQLRYGSLKTPDCVMILLSSARCFHCSLDVAGKVFDPGRFADLIERDKLVLQSTRDSKSGNEWSLHGQESLARIQGIHETSIEANIAFKLLISLRWESKWLSTGLWSMGIWEMLVVFKSSESISRELLEETRKKVVGVCTQQKETILKCYFIVAQTCVHVKATGDILKEDCSTTLHFEEWSPDNR